MIHRLCRMPSLCILAMTLALSGCQSTTPAPVPASDIAELTPAQHELNAGYALLYSLISDEARVDGLLSIKSLPEPTENLIRQIAQRSREAKSKLEDLARQDITLAFNRQNLPEAEADSRRRIAEKLTRQLLFSNGVQLEVLLLATQFQSTNYGQALARSLQTMDHHPQRRQDLQQLAEDYDAFNKAILKRLETLSR